MCGKKKNVARKHLVCLFVCIFVLVYCYCCCSCCFAASISLVAVLCGMFRSFAKSSMVIWDNSLMVCMPNSLSFAALFSPMPSTFVRGVSFV